VYREGLVGFAKDDKKTFDEIDGFIRQIRDKETLASNTRISVCERGGVEIRFDSPDKLAVIRSPVWQMAGFTMQFAQLAPGASLRLNQDAGTNYVKVLRGDLSNINRGPFAAPKTVRNTLVTRDYIDAGKDGAMVFVMVKTAGTPVSVNSMRAGSMEMQGVMQDNLPWRRVDELDWGRDVFSGSPFYNMRAFRVVDSSGKEVCYVQFWAAGEGVDCGMHKHEIAPTTAAPTYCEVHLGLFNGTGNGGMVDENGDSYIIGRGDEHGPFWKIDAATGKPVFRDSTAVWYEDHKWQAGGDKVAAKNFDIWAAFEMNPDFAVIDQGTLASNSGLVFASLAEQGHTLSKDFITPLMLQSGQLESQIKAGIVRDTTTNPTSNAGVWDLMVNKNKEWLPLIEEMVRQGMTTQQIYDNLFIEHLVVPTMQLFDTYKVGEGSGYLHGYVSYEFRPHFTSDPDLTSEKDTVEFERQVGVALDELIRLDTLITEKSGGLHNFFIKVPATHVGIEAGKRAIARHGININWTLIATLDQYKEVAAAYKQARMTSIFTKQGPYGVSVASDFVSRTDREIDPLLEETAPEYKMQSGLAYAIGNIYRHFEREFLQNQDWIDFAGRRNIPIQQIYWGSTGVKVKGEYTANPHYAGPLRLNGTVNTAPPNVVDIMAEDAPFDGNVETPYYTAHEEVLSKLISLSIDINAIQEKVYREGLVGFAKDDKKTFDEIDGFIRQIRDKETLASNSDLKLIDTFKANPSLLKINCQVQHYEWGNRDFIPALLGVDNSGGKPYAELWIGAHPKAPAQANIGNSVISLDKLISGAAEEILGQGGIGNQLPYLLKVLSAGDMLSIQAHPDKNQAAEGYRKENEAGIPIGASNRNYKDSNHKPELIVALTDFYALNGFRPLAEIAETLENTEEFRMLMPSVFMTRLKAVNLTQEGRRELLRELYVKIMTMGQDEVDVILNPLISRLKTGSFDKDQREYWVLKADKQYTSDGHADRGIFSIYLLNLVHLNPSDGMYLDAGELHAYLQGTGMECMANSDNVLRGGLTPKYVDAPELINVLTFNDGKPQILTSENAFFDAESVYRTPSKEFVVSFITARNGQNYKSPRAHSADTFLVLDGEVEIRAGQQSLRLAKGDTVMIPAVLGEYEITGEGKLCKATVPAATLGSNQILAHAQQSFVDFVSGQRVAGVRFNPDGGMRSEHGESYLDVGSPDYFFRGANAFNYPAVKNVIIGSLIHDRSEFAAREGEVFYIMNHGFIATPANLRALVDNGITDGRIHDTFFPQRSPYFPGSEQYQQTGGHYQGNSVDVKFVTEGKGLQILIWMGKDRKLHTLTQEMSPGKWVYALPGTSDVVVNLGGLRFNDISFKVGAATENRIREDMGISVNFNEASLKSLARAGCVFVCEKADNDKGYVIMPYFDGFVRGAVDFVDTAPNITPVLDGSQVGMDLIELYKNRPEILLGFYDKGFAEGLSGFFKGERSLASNNMVDLVNYAKRFVPEAVDVIADIESVEERLRSMRGRFLIRNADTGKDMPSGDLLEIALNATDKIVLLIQLENGAYKTLILNKADNIPADTGLASNLGIQRRELKAMQSGN
ncbi:MAG: mannose-6-phosphate isomerase, class I, partial [Candidatus Omnitrophota bacterium]